MYRRRALIVGIESYRPGQELYGCVQDARAMAQMLSRHKDGSKNFDCSVLLDRAEDGSRLSCSKLRSALARLFDADSDVLLYFAGHAAAGSAGAMLCPQDAEEHEGGIPFQELFDLATRSRAPQILILLDCCSSGELGALTGTRDLPQPLSLLRENMTLLAASRSRQPALESGTAGGRFTSALLDGLEGGAADHIGSVTAPALYSYASRRFDAWDQRPVFKMNATDVLVVRRCEPLVQRLQLQHLPELFCTMEHRYQLDPAYEPEDEHGHISGPIDERKVAIAQLLKVYRDAGLVRAAAPERQLYWAARRSGCVELTARGREYWWLVVNDKI